MPKIVDRSEMQARIIGAGMTAFQRHGYAATKMTDIAEEAGLAKGTLYLYFKSKEQLTLALMQSLFAEWIAGLEGLPQPRNLGDFGAQVRSNVVLDADEQKGVRMFFEITSSGVGSDALLSAAAEFQDALGAFQADQLASLKDAGHIRQDIDVDAMGRTLAAMVDGLVIHRALFVNDESRYRRMVDETIQLFLRGLQR